MQGNVSDVAEQILEIATAGGTSFAEIFIEVNSQDEIKFENQQVDQVRGGKEIGVGIRLVKDGRVSYSIANSPDPEILLPLVKDAVGSLRSHTNKEPAVMIRSSRESAVKSASNLSLINPLPAIDYDQIKTELTSIDQHARIASPHVHQVAIRFTASRKQVFIANSGGTQVSEQRYFSRVYMQAIASRKGIIRTGVNNAALATGEKELFNSYPTTKLGYQVGRLAETMLDAVPAPTGVLPVVVGNGRGGVLIHEACVHCLEGDFISRENSVYKNKLGQMVAQPLVTILDDGTLANQAGTSGIDDEGQQTRCNVLVEKGRLLSYLTDRTYAQKLNHKATGNGRRQSYAFLPIPRMTNTFIAPGEDTPDEIIADTYYGVYARQVSGGEVNPVTGEFVFAVTEGYLIEDGRLTKPLIPFTLTGNGPDVLQGIDRVAHDFELAAAMCGKNGQFVPVSVGQPTIRVQNLVIGGTNK